MRKISEIINKMSLREKIGQLNLVSYKEEILEEVKRGEIGAVLNADGYETVLKLQEAALSSPQKIPLLIGEDVIHGYQTIFPVPLAESCSFNLELIKDTSFYSMLESRDGGINWIYAPMIDLTNDLRWGRIMETSGEDPYLTSLIARCRVRGIQKEVDGVTTASCAKHYLGYGAVESGLDYTTSDFSEHKMRQYYLPPFVSAINEGVFSIMNSFTTYNNLPVTMSKYLLHDVLREEANFKGSLVTDWQCLNQLVKYRTASNEKIAAKLGLEVGIDIDMHSGIYKNYLEKVIFENPYLEQNLNKSVRRVLDMKQKMGLFDHPIQKKNPREFKKIIRQCALRSAEESIILFLNRKNTLPLAKNTKALVVGPFLEDQDIHLGAWSCKGIAEEVISIKKGLEKLFANLKFINTPLNIDEINFKSLKEQLVGMDYVILVLGEPRQYSGENNSRVKLDLPFNQDQLIDFFANFNIPIITIISAGRPLLISNTHNKSHALLWSFHLGSEAGNAIARVLLGEVIPSAKTTVTFPKEFGQIPIYYNRFTVGRKELINYVDGDLDPLYPFGYGLSYANFKYIDFDYQYNQGNLKIEVIIENTSLVDAKEIIQVCLIPHDSYHLSYEMQLIGFTKVMIPSKTQMTITIHTIIDLTSLKNCVTIQVGPSSVSGLKKTIKL